jgi:hypothetical protein
MTTQLNLEREPKPHYQVSESFHAILGKGYLVDLVRIHFYKGTDYVRETQRSYLDSTGVPFFSL